jgi:hypothetical protein
VLSLFLSSPNVENMEAQTIQSKIYEIRGYKVMLDADLSLLYGTETKVLKQAVRRNRNRFPPDFMFELTSLEVKNLRSQIVTSSWGGNIDSALLYLMKKDALLISQEKRKRIGFKTKS